MTPAEKPATPRPTRTPASPIQAQQAQPSRTPQQGDALFWSWAAPTSEQRP